MTYDVVLRHSDRLRLFAVPVCFLCGADEVPSLGWTPSTPDRITSMVGMVPDSPLERISFEELAGDWTETWRGAKVALRVVGCQVCWCPEGSAEAVLPIGFFREYGEKGGGMRLAFGDRTFTSFRGEERLAVWHDFLGEEILWERRNPPSQERGPSGSSAVPAPGPLDSASPTGRS